MDTSKSSESPQVNELHQWLTTQMGQPDLAILGEVERSGWDKEAFCLVNDDTVEKDFPSFSRPQQKKVVEYARRLRELQGTTAPPGGIGDADLEKQIRVALDQSKIHSLLQNPKELERTSYYIPPTSNPFYNNIVQAKVPATAQGRPDLLLHDLPTTTPHDVFENLTALPVANVTIDEEKIEFIEPSLDVCDIDDSNQVIEEPELPKGLHTSAVEVVKFCKTLYTPGSPGKIVVMLGVSGCAKTRTCYEILCHKVGLYFVTEVQRNGGSGDMTLMREEMKSPCEHIEPKGQFQAQALLLSRCLVLLYALQHTPTMEKFAYHWLCIQVKPKEVLGLVNGVDLFTAVYQKCAQMTPEYVSKRLQEVMKHLDEKIGPLYVVLDEAQVLFYDCVRMFDGPSSGEKAKRSLLSKLVRCWSSIQQITLLCSGTGLRLRHAIGEIASAVLKPGQDMTFVDFGGYYDQEEMKQYISRYLSDIAPHLMTKIFALIKGRYRFAAHFVSQVLTYPNGGPKEAVLTNVLEEMRSEVERKDSDNDTSSPRYQFAQLVDPHSSRPANHIHGVSPLEILRALTTSYYLFGRKYTFSDENILQLVGQAVCPLERTPGNKLEACIAEPYVAWAALCFFKDHNMSIENHILEMIGVTKLYPASSGLFIQTVLLPRILEYFGAGLLGAHPYFSQWKKENNLLPSWFRDATFYTPLRDQGKEWILFADEDHTLDHWLANPDIADAFFAENAARHDAVVKLRLKDGSFRLAIMQFKFRLAATTADQYDAIWTTDPLSSYTSKSRNQIVVSSKNKKRKAAVTALERANFAIDQGCFRIVFAYPATIKPGVEQQCVDKAFETQSVLAILDFDRSRKVLSLKEWNFLHAFKMGQDFLPVDQWCSWSTKYDATAEEATKKPIASTKHQD